MMDFRARSREPLGDLGVGSAQQVDPELDEVGPEREGGSGLLSPSPRSSPRISSCRPGPASAGLAVSLSLKDELVYLSAEVPRLVLGQVDQDLVPDLDVGDRDRRTIGADRA